MGGLPATSYCLAFDWALVLVVEAEWADLLAGSRGSEATRKKMKCLGVCSGEASEVGFLGPSPLGRLGGGATATLADLSK